MTPLDKDTILKWHETLDDEVSIGITRTDDDRSGRLLEFCTKLSELAPAVKVKQEDGDAESLPAIHVGPSVRYAAVPEGKELAPFLEVANGLSQNASALSEKIRKTLDKIVVPAMIKVYVAPQCPFCPEVVRQLLRLTAEGSTMHLTIIDGTLFQETAEKDRIKSVPTVILDDQFRWTGSVRIEEIAEMALNRDPSMLGADSLQKMIESGNAEDLAGMMMGSGKIYPAFMDLLVHPKWPVRLGAMVAFEFVVENDRKMTTRITEELWDRFSRVEDTVKGDILYLLGESKDPGVISKLRSVADSSYPDEVREAAVEALETFPEK